MPGSSGGLVFLVTLVLGFCGCIEIQFTSPDSGGFFIRHQEDPPSRAAPPPQNTGEEAALLDEDLTVKTTQFTILDSKHPVTLRASYGPFSSKETVSPAYGAPMLAPRPGPENGTDQVDASTLSKPLIVDFSARLVNKEVRKEQPTVRVIFTGKYRRKSICAVISAENNGSSVKAFSVPKGEEEENFLAEMTIPSAWWPPLNSKVGKQPKQMVKISYWIQKECGGGEQVLLVPVQHVGDIPLTTGQAGYRQIAGDETLHLLIPQSPVYPGSKLYVPVFLEQPRPQEDKAGGAGSSGSAGPRTDPHIGVLVVRASTRKGAKILGVEESSKNWTLRVELSPRGNLATVTAFRRDANTLARSQDIGPEEVFNFLYSVDNSDQQVWKGCKLSWHIKYQTLAENQESMYTRGPRLRHRLHVHKDDVQAVLPISKSSELLNTAVLTGRQVSDPLKVLMVSQAGDIADVTLHTSCTTNDDSALKVSSSCTSVYLDGSETRGALAAQIQVKYGTYSGTANLRVWMPEVPVILDIPDPHLAIVDGWRVPERLYSKRDAGDRGKKKEMLKEKVDVEVEGSGLRLDEEFLLKEEILTLDYVDSTKQEEDEKKKEGGCSNRFQQTHVRVFARFTAEDPDSGRREYLISRSAELDLTSLTAKSIRVVDPRVVNLQGTILRGTSVGRTEIQVISPVTGRVIGASEVRVLRVKEQITGIRVRLITGINLTVVPGSVAAVYRARAEISDQLLAKYQEGLLDIEILYTDGTSTPLREVDEEEYYLAVESKDSDIVAYAPAIGSTDPRVIAVGEGEGDLLTVSLELADKCHNKVQAPLAVSLVSMSVQTSGRNSEDWKADRKKDQRKRRKDRKNNKHSIKSVDMGDISEILSNIALRDDISRSSADSGHQQVHHPEVHHGGYGHEATTLEVGMYILLAVFCVAITVFMASCFVYASKHNQPPGFPAEQRSRSVQNAHDWVWLGRHTLDKSSVGTSASKDVLDTSLRSRDSHGYPRGARPDQRSINIIPNPCIEFGYSPRNRVGVAGPAYQGSGFRVNLENGLGGAGLHPRGPPMYPLGLGPNIGIRVPPARMETRSVDHVAQQSNHTDFYAELPRRRSPKPKKERSRAHRNGGSAKPNPGQPPRAVYSAGQSSQFPTYPNQFSPTESVQSTESKQSRVSEQSIESSAPSSRPSINSATYTRQKPVQPDQGDFLPVGFPIFAGGLESDGGGPGGRGEGLWAEMNPWDEGEGQGFQNPWEALHSLSEMPGHSSQFYFQDEAGMNLDLQDEPPPYHLINKQSPASALPPDPTFPLEQEFNSSPTRGEYIPLNPDINKPTPPRFGSLKRVRDPFKVSDKDSPPVSAEKLSPTHVFESFVDDSRADFQSAIDISDLSAAEDDSSVCSADSSELGPLDDLPHPNQFRPSEASLYGTYSKVNKHRDEKWSPSHGQVHPATLDDIAIGSLDYEQLMSYFEGLRESAA